MLLSPSAAFLLTFHLPQKSWCTNENTEVNRMFAANVFANYSGIPNGGRFDASVKQQAQYKQFVGSLQDLISVSGGDSVLGSKLSNNTASYQEYQRWVDSTRTKRNSVISFEIVELWTLMKQAQNSKLVDYADELANSFAYIIGHPNPYKTPVTLDIQSGVYPMLCPGNHLRVAHTLSFSGRLGGVQSAHPRRRYHT